MPVTGYSGMDDDQLLDLLLAVEDRLDAQAASEIAARDSMVTPLSQIIMNRQNWLAELPEWWAVVHAAFLLGHRGGEESVTPLLSALRWADAFDCDWVTEALPSIYGKIGAPMFPGLVAVARDATAGWSARDVAMKGLAAIALADRTHNNYVFRVIGERFMDEGEDRLIRQLAGRILLDFKCLGYRLALLAFAREELNHYAGDAWYLVNFTPDEVEAIFRTGEAETWHYQDEWMRFYDPAEIQRRQKRWTRERLTTSRVSSKKSGGGRVVPILPPESDPDFPSGEPE